LGDADCLDSPLAQFDDFRPQLDAPVPSGRRGRQDYVNPVNAEVAAQLRAELALDEARVAQATAAIKLVETKLQNLQAQDKRARQQGGGAAGLGFEPDDDGYEQERADYKAKQAALAGSS
jgi:hypothetical protein